MAVDLVVDSNQHVRGVNTFFGVTFSAPAVVVTTGTFMNGRIWVGRKSLPAGTMAAVTTFCAQVDFLMVHNIIMY